ncbi:MAG: type II toxin-antitoxin system RelE/ParE family toxin [Pyrinomonadaceae bacterium]|nr:type II toxin-antitoxin system RelE/ParE family toxin [Pyrinomonadaceae bacterium]
MNDLVSSTLRRIEIAERALSDLEEIWVHFPETNEKTADKILRQITEKFPKLLNFPEMGKERNDLLVGLRSFPTGKFIIFYQKTDLGIEIVRVFHSSRDIQQVFDEMIPLEP